MSKFGSMSRNSVATKFLMPWLVGAFVLTVLPLVATILLSCMEWDGVDPSQARWVGFDHYQHLIGIKHDQDHDSATRLNRYRDPLFYRSLYNSLFFAALATPLSLFVSLLLALMLNAPLRGIAVFRSLAYLPHVLGGVATILIWSWVFNPTYGPINQTIEWAYGVLDPVVRFFGGEGTGSWLLPGWLASETWCMPAVVCMHAWTAGGAVFIFLASLQRVDPDSQAAALIDGANRWRRFRLIVLPQLTPAILFNLITGFAASMQSFNYAYLLYNRAQNDGLLFVVLYIYRCAFEPPYRLGYASAMACVLFVILLVLSSLTFITSKWWVHYES